MPVIDNPKPHVIPEGENATPLEVVGATASDKLVIIMVGLPGTGKTHVSRRICRYVSFFHDIPSQIFNVGEYRRKMLGVKLPASFYDHSNAEATAKRKEACDKALNDLIEYMSQDGVRLGVYDATNSTPEARAGVLKRLKDSELGVKKMFIEVICDDENVLSENIRSVKTCTPDYKDVDPEEAVKDFAERRKNYMDVYKEVEDHEGSYVKILNYHKFVIHNIRGYLPLKVVHFTMNLHTMPRTFYLTRHGQSEYNTVGKIGGDSGLSQNGLEYAKRLAKYANEVIGQEEVEKENGEKVMVPRPARLWTSTLLRTKETAQFIQHQTLEGAEFDNGDKVKWVNFRPNARRNLDELYAGTCDGMTYKEIEEMYPEEFAARQSDKLKYRYPRGESYMDVMLRLEPLALDMERTRQPVLIVCHQGILRILLAYFTGLTREEAPYVKIPLNHVTKLTPHAYGCDQEIICLLDKNYSLNDGESYMDVTLRLEPLSHDLERTREPILIVGHQGIHRILYAYFMGLSRKEAPFVRIPLNHVIILRPHAYGCDEERVCLMPKHEMISDGQDEPVTSMPTKSLINEDKKEEDGSTLTNSGSDPLLDAPSC